MTKLLLENTCRACSLIQLFSISSKVDGVLSASGMPFWILVSNIIYKLTINSNVQSILSVMIHVCFVY